MRERIHHAWRVAGTGLSFLAFGVGGLVLGLLVLPPMLWLVRDPERRRRWARRLVQRSFADRQQGQAQALYVSLAGIGGAFGALYAGYSWKSLGPAWTFAIASLVALLAAFIIATRLPPERP